MHKLPTSSNQSINEPLQNSKEAYPLMCGFFKLENSALLKSVCLIDIIFFLVALIFNATWTGIEISGSGSSVCINTPFLYGSYGAIMLGNVALIIYAIHFKKNFRRFNMTVNNCYFEGYYYLRIMWAVVSTILTIGILLDLYWLETHAEAGRKNPSKEFLQFRQISTIFSVIYILYSVFCLSSSSGFRNSWRGMLNKDIEFYFS